MEYFKDEECYEYFCGFVIADGHMSRSDRGRGNRAGCLSFHGNIIPVRFTDSVIFPVAKGAVIFPAYRIQAFPG